MPTVQKQFMFMHIPKTAGTTFVLTLARHFRGKKRLSYYFFKPIKDHPKYSAAYLNHFDLVYGHIPFDRTLIPERGIEYFTFLREPRGLILSGYKYIKGGGEHLVKNKVNIEDYKLKDFLTGGLAKKADNIMVRYLSGNAQKDYLTINENDLQSAIKNFDTYFHVFGLTEYFDESLVLLSDYMQWPQLNYIKENLSSYVIDKRELDKETEKLIGECTKYDDLLYQHAKERFLKLIEEKKGKLESGLKELREGNEKKKFILSLRNKGSLLVSNLIQKFK